MTTTATTSSLTTLDKEINDNLTKYNQAMNNYLQSMNDSSSSSKSFIIHPNYEFWGTSGIEDGYVNNSTECLNMCLNNSLCSGATYNKAKKYCWARTGESQLIPNNNMDAILTLTQQQLNYITSLNQTITDLQMKKMEILNKEKIESNEPEKMKLNKFMEKLKMEKKKLTALLNSEYSYNKEYDDSSLIVNKNALYYKIMAVLIIICVFITIKSIMASNK